MKSGILSLNRAIASAVVLAGLVMSGPSPASASEMKTALKPKEVKSLMANAKTPADHMELARSFMAMAERHDAEAAEHEALAAEYTRNPQVSAAKHPMAPNSAEHCKFFAEHCRRTAADMRAKARQQEEMALSK
ncbi:hypothetical protein [uncultured Paludibaculum sp.]|uniref:hypothetical protein n=1 Tax=uncultured Paludibaculum sp. TaxID=1765020 RepID=UPI002AAB4484|nr:hypothetical protein [uncultured Paludibaculum sp.]